MGGFMARQAVDLRVENRMLIREQPICKGDGSVLTWEVTLTSGGRAVDLTGAKAYLYCARPGGDGADAPGTTRSDAEISGNIITAELPPDAANYPGTVGCTIRIVPQEGGSYCAARLAVLAIDLIGQTIVDVGMRIPNIDEVAASMARCDEAAKAAEDAADAARRAAQAAQAAAEKAAPWSGARAVAQSLPASNAPTVGVTTAEDGTRVLSFGIPKGNTGETGATGPQGPKGDTGATGPKGDKGDTGATPQLTVTAKTGEPGTEVSAVQGGTPENPTLELTIPRGDTGDIGGLTINGKAPDASGAVTLTAQDVGALGASATAADASKLGGQGPGYYATAQDVSQLRAMVGPFMFRYEAEDGHLYMDYDNGYEADKWSVSADGHLLYTF